MHVTTAGRRTRSTSVTGVALLYTRPSVHPSPSHLTSPVASRAERWGLLEVERAGYEMEGETKDGDELDKGAALVEPFWGMASPDSPTDECYGGGGDRSLRKAALTHNST